jgi:hypothetical protein
MRFVSLKSTASKLAVALVAFGIVGMSSVHADTVSFTTSGVFVDPSTNQIYGSSVLSNDNTGNILLSFTGATSTDLNAPTFGSLGTFTVSRLDPALNDTESFSDNFVLTIDQIAPTGSSATFPPATIDGTITYNASSSSSTLTISFGSTIPSVTIGQFTYTPTADLQTINNPTTGDTTLQGRIAVTSVPSPVSASAGLGLLGILALGKLHRKSLQA